MFLSIRGLVNNDIGDKSHNKDSIFSSGSHVIVFIEEFASMFFSYLYSALIFYHIHFIHSQVLNILFRKRFFWLGLFYTRMKPPQKENQLRTICAICICISALRIHVLNLTFFGFFSIVPLFNFYLVFKTFLLFVWLVLVE